MSGVIDSIERAQLRRVPVFQAGDRVRVHFQVVEGTRRRTQVFEGTVIKRQGTSARETFTVRKQSFGVGVERTFPVHSPKIERIEVAARGDVRRAKLYYLRERVGRRARVRERRWIPGQDDAFEAGAMPPDDAVRPGEEELAEATDAEAAATSEVELAAAPEADPADDSAADPAEAPEADPADASEAALAQPADAEAAQTAGGEPQATDGDGANGDSGRDLEAKGDEPAQEPAEKTET